MLMDAERIERDVQMLEDIQRAELHAYGTHEPKELRKLRDRVVSSLMKRATMTDAELMAYALEQGRRAKASEAVS